MFSPSAKLHARKRRTDDRLGLAEPDRGSKTQPKLVIGYEFGPGALVSETRKSGGNSTAAAAAVMVSGLAFTK